VFRYFYDRQIPYCKLYDMQMWAGNSLRVSTPLHAESAKRFDIIKGTTPDFYRRVTAVFPEMRAHERYFKELDRAALQARYGQSYEGVRAWIDDNLQEEAQHAAATARLDSVLVRARRDPDLYPPRYLLTTFMAGGFKREILPQKRKG
jgi:hypothetical protein